MAKKFLKSLGFASEGLESAFKTQRNFRIQIAVGATSLVIGWIIGFSRIEFAILFLSICFVLSAELVNTVFETIVDMISQDIDSKAKLAKDVGAGVVLINAIIVLAVGFLLFVPHLLSFLQG